MPKEKPTEAQEQTIRDMHAMGKTRADMVRMTGLKYGTVNSFLRSNNMDVPEAQLNRKNSVRMQDQAAEVRNALELEYARDAARLRKQLWEPAPVYSFGGKDNTFAEATLDEPDASSKLKLIQASQAALRSSLQIAEYNAGSKTETVNLILATAEVLGLKDGE